MYLNITMINPLYVNINIFKNPYILKQNQLVRGIFQIFFQNFLMSAIEDNWIMLHIFHLSSEK